MTGSDTPTVVIRARGTLARLMRFTLAAASLTVGQVSFAMEPVTPCVLYWDSYVFVQSNLQHSEVSQSYAHSIYGAVRGILTGFLTDRERCLFKEDDKGLDLSDHDQSRVLNLYCEVTRRSFELLLSVRIDTNGSGETLLNFETTAPFFEPDIALSSFAASFSELFAGPIRREYSPSTMPRVFDWSHYLPRKVVMAGIVTWTAADLEQDLRATEGVSEDVMRSLQDFRTREAIEGTLSSLGTLTFLGTGVAILILGGGLRSTGDSWELRTPQNVPDALGAACLAGFLTVVGVMIEQGLFPPRRLIRSLNEWER